MERFQLELLLPGGFWDKRDDITLEHACKQALYTKKAFAP
jgi:hypothetical protein